MHASDEAEDAADDLLPEAADLGGALSATATPAEAGERIDRWFARTAEAAGLSLSRTRIQALMAEGAASPAPGPKGTVESGVTYTLRLPAPTPSEVTPEAIPLEVLFEDTHLILIHKPAGLAVHPGPGHPSGTLVNALLHHCGDSLRGIGGVERPGIVHRLDKDTSGVMVAAKTDRAFAGLAEMFAAHDLERVYTAVVQACPRPRLGTVHTRISRDPKDRLRMKALRDLDSEVGREAITHYQTVEPLASGLGADGEPGAAVLSCQLETGRTHQIRVHLSHINVPVIGDPLYNRRGGIRLTGKTAAIEAARATANTFPRQALHAGRLAFAHPVTGRKVAGEAPMPADMASLIEVLRAVS
jgi:23S rRNA pseudouridine1911/1915/1917 synthase